MGNAGRNGGQYYTPRPLIRAMISVTDPQLGETIYDGAPGSAAHIPCASELLTRHESAEVGAQAIKGKYDDKLATFLTFVLEQYVETGAEDLDRSKLPDFLKLKFGNPSDGAKALGGVKNVSDSFVGFQKYLYR